MLVLNLTRQVVDLDQLPVKFSQKDPATGEMRSDYTITVKDLVMESLNKNKFDEVRLNTRRRYELLKYLATNPTASTLSLDENEFEFILDIMRIMPYHVAIIGNLYDAIMTETAPVPTAADPKTEEPKKTKPVKA